MSFLSEFAQISLQQGNTDYERTAIILPNQRAKRVLQKELVQGIGKTSFLPQIYTISDLMELLSPLKKQNKNKLLLLLYQVYGQFEHAQGKSFNSFLSWGALFLQDINEIDMQLAKAENIFTNLSEVKEIDTSFLKSQLSENQLNYIQFYTILKEIYEQFISLLYEHKIGYEGLIYRDAAEHIGQYAGKLDYSHYFFVGFNALSPSEIEVIRYFRDHFSAEIFFDLDLFYYGKDKKTHISLFIDHIVKELHVNPVQKVNSHYSTIPKQVYISGVSQQVNQVMYAAEILNSMPPEELNSTAVVFADESLLLPFLHAYDCSKANLTMGYPLKALPEYHLLETLINLVKNSNRFLAADKNAERIFYHKDVMALYQNPLIRTSFFENEDAFDLFINELIQKNKVFMTYDEIPKIHTLPLPNLGLNGEALLHEWINFFLLIEQEVSTHGLCFIYLIIKELKNVIDLLHEFPIQDEINMDIMDYFIRDALAGKTISMRGDFDKGLQVMGLLETRSLDFDHVIMLSVNEGIIPMGKSQNSLLLYEIKKYFKMPTFKEKDAIYAYHFFRLLQRAKTVHLIYDCDSQKSVAEPSRFVRQLQFEVQSQQLQDVIKIEQRQISIPPNQNETSAKISIHKDESVLKDLQNIRYSPSGLIQYINCPLQFYFRYVAKIKPLEEISEKIEASILGLVIHQVLEEFANEIINAKNSVSDIISSYEKNIEQHIESAFINNKINSNELKKGKLYLAFEVTKKYLTSYLKKLREEFKDAPVVFLGTEVDVATTLMVDDIKVVYHGKIDRVDLSENKVLILDFKTGKVESDKLKVLYDLEDIFEDSSYKQAFQLLSYAFLYHKDSSEYAHIKTDTYECGIASLQSLVSNNPNYIHLLKIEENNKTTSTEITTKILGEFEAQLIDLFRNLFDSKMDFHQTENLDHCKYCDYQSICKRQNVDFA